MKVNFTESGKIINKDYNGEKCKTTSEKTHSRDLSYDQAFDKVFSHYTFERYRLLTKTPLISLLII